VTNEHRRAFMTALEHSHGRELRRFLSARMRKAAADVPDLVQEVFLRMLRIDDYEAIRNPQAYLYTIASHVLHQHALRQSSRPQTVETGEIERELQLMAEEDPEQQVELEQRFEKLGMELKKASPRAYAALVMHRCDGVPLKEIGARMGVSHSMAKRYLATALSFCQQRLAELEESE
jgi:RNA polymerase sigma factor (sigma-70 family)